MIHIHITVPSESVIDELIEKAENVDRCQNFNPVRNVNKQWAQNHLRSDSFDDR